MRQTLTHNFDLQMAKPLITIVDSDHLLQSFFHLVFGFQIPFSVIMPVTSRRGVTSKAGFDAKVPSGQIIALTISPLSSRRAYA